MKRAPPLAEAAPIRSNQVQGNVSRRGAFGKPDQRPTPPLHRQWAFAVVLRSREIPDTHKLVYLRILELDRGATGCYASDERLGESIGKAPATVEKAKRQLATWGLAAVHRTRTATS